MPHQRFVYASENVRGIFDSWEEVMQERAAAAATRPLAATRPRFVSELLDAQRHHLFVVRVINEIVVPDAIQQPR